MEFELSPDVYTDELQAKHDAYFDEENNKFKKKAGNLKLFDKSFKSYILACCHLAKKVIFVIAIILAIGGAVAGGALGLDKEMNPVLYYVLAVVLGAICGVIAGFVAGFIGGYVYGAIFSVILCPIGYPIYLLICNAKEKSVDKKTDAMRDESKKRIDEYFEELKNEAIEYEDRFLEAAEKKCEEYMESRLVSEVAEWVKDELRAYVNRADRSTKVEKVEVPFAYCVERDCVLCTIYDRIKEEWSTDKRVRYDFEAHRYAPIPNVLSQYAIAQALEKKVFSLLLAEYPKDETGTEWDLGFKYKDYWIDDDDKEAGIAVQVDIDYEAPNGNFKPLQNW